MSDEKVGLDVIQALEGLDQSRRAQVSRTAEVALPEHIRSIVSSEVVVTILEDLLPYPQIDYSQLLAFLKGQYRLRLRPPDNLQQMARLMGINSADLDDPTILQLTLEQGNQALLGDGRFPTGAKSFVPIHVLGLDKENIAAKVGDRTEFAELLISETFELLWQAAESPKKWESPEVQDQIRLKSYATHTKVDTKSNLLKLLADPVTDFLRKNLDEGARFGAAVMPRSTVDNFGVPETTVTSLTFDGLILRISVFEPASGRNQNETITLSVGLRSEQGKGLVDVLSGLPFDDHARLVEGLVEALSQ